ncbi:MAG: YbaN family protein [Bacteroidia bacterium]|nr:YbaN family protein [Bacteroidia bacterium]
MNKANNNVLKVLLIIAGSLSVVLGVIGIFLPVLPTTPFLLLAAALFARSSEKFYKIITTNKLFGKYIKDYNDGKGIKLQVKISAITILWVSIIISVIILKILLLKLSLIFIATLATIYIISIKTLKNNTQK